MNLKVTLLSYTQDPIGTICNAWRASRNKEWHKATMVDDEDLFSQIISDKIPVAELVDFVFVLDGVSISLREQMVRHRVGVKIGPGMGVDVIPDLADSTFWAQSMRVIDMSAFAEEQAYDVPDSVQMMGAGEAHRIYTLAMEQSALFYKKLVDVGVPAEDARQVIPLGAQHRITWKLNLAALQHIIGKRSCWILQSGFWAPVISGMIDELVKQVSPIFRSLGQPPCVSKCDFCGCLFRTDNKQRVLGKDPLPPCPLWAAKKEDEYVTDSTNELLKWKFDGNRWNPVGHVSAIGRSDQYSVMEERFKGMWGWDDCVGTHLGSK